MKLSEKLSENIDGQDVKVRHLIFTVSNFLSFSRIPAASLIIYWHSETHNPFSWGVLTMLAYIVFSDYMDGFMARWLNQVSELGKSIDPLSDKISAFMLFTYMVVNGWIPYWFLWFFMVRDGLILLGSLFLKLKYGKVAMSVTSGKIAVNILALYWLGVFFYPHEFQIHTYLLIATMLIMVYSFFDYMFRYFKIMQGARFN